MTDTGTAGIRAPALLAELAWLHTLLAAEFLRDRSRAARVDDVAREYQKLARPAGPGDFGPWYGLVAERLTRGLS